MENQIKAYLKTDIGIGQGGYFQGGGADKVKDKTGDRGRIDFRAGHGMTGK